MLDSFVGGIESRSGGGEERRAQLLILFGTKYKGLYTTNPRGSLPTCIPNR